MFTSYLDYFREDDDHDDHHDDGHNHIAYVVTS